MAGVFRDANDGDGDDGSGAGVRVLRRGASGTAVRPDESGGDCGRTRHRRDAGAERGVPSVRHALGLPGSGRPAVSSADQGQGGASDPLRAHEFLLRSAVPERCGSERSGAAMASEHGQCPVLCRARGEPLGVLRTRGAEVSGTVDLAAVPAAAGDAARIVRESSGSGGPSIAHRVCGDGAMSGAMSRRDRVRAKLADLKLPGSLEAVDEILARADSGGLSVACALEELLDAQLDLRVHRRLESARRTSRLPHLKTLEDFDFTLQPSVERTQLASLHELGFLRRHENVVFCAPPPSGRGQDPSGNQSGGGGGGDHRRPQRVLHNADGSRGITASGAGERPVPAPSWGVHPGGAADRGRDRLPAAVGGRRAVVLPVGQCPARTRFDDPDHQQGLRGIGECGGRRGDGHGHARSPAASPPRGEHPRQQLPDAGIQGHARPKAWGGRRNRRRGEGSSRYAPSAFPAI